MFSDFMTPSDPDITHFLILRESLDKKERNDISHPMLSNKKDAFIYWVNIYKQDRPVFFAAGLFGLIFMPIYGLLKLLFMLI